MLLGNIKKGIVLCLMALMTCAANSDDKLPLELLNQTMGKYYKACLYLGDGAYKGRVSNELLDLSINLFNETFQNIENLVLVPIDAEASLPLDGRFSYSYAFAKKVWVEKGSVYVDQGNARGDETIYNSSQGKCRVAHVAIKPKSTCRYNVMIKKGQRTMLCVAEPLHRINVSLMLQGETIQTTSYEYGMTAYCSWNSELDDCLTLTITNLTNEATSVVVLVD